MKTFVVVLLCLVACALSEPTGEEGDLFEGDMVLIPDQLMALTEQASKGNQFAAMKSRHWKINGQREIIKYYIEDSLTSQSEAMSAIRAAVNEYHNKTCIRFQRVYTKPTGPHISFFRGRGCYSYVGKIQRTEGQQISLGNGCWYKGTTMHEMGHALGFYHEQSRPDRDNYVRIVTENIVPSHIHNFNKYNTDRINSLGSPYDYESMMHYGKGYFAKTRGQITLQTIDPKYQNVIGQRNGFSQGDIEQFNKMYCSNVVTTKSPTQTKVATKSSTQRPVTRASTTRRTVTPTSECKNRFSGSYCEQNVNRCTTSSIMKKYCHKTCGICTGATTQRPATTTRRPVTTTPKSECKNRFSDNYCQGQVNRCTTSSTIRTYCSKTCGGCTECKDKRTDDKCSSWKVICDTNNYVKEQCQASCNLC